MDEMFERPTVEDVEAARSAAESAAQQATATARVIHYSEPLDSEDTQLVVAQAWA